MVNLNPLPILRPFLNLPQPINFELSRRMKSCSWIQYASDRKRKNGNAKKRTAKKFVVSKSALPASFFFLFLTPTRAVAARTSAVNNPPPVVTSSFAPPKPKPPTKKEGKKILKGVVMVKKKTKLPTASTIEKDLEPTTVKTDDLPPDAKRRKVDYS